MHKFFHVSVVKWSTINQSALFNLTWSRILSLLRDSLLLGTGTIMLFTPILTFIELFILRNFLTIVWATTKTVRGPTIVT